MKTFQKLLKFLDYFFYEFRLRTGIIVYLLFIENLYISLWAVALILFICNTIFINIDLLHNSEYIFLAFFLQNIYFIFKYFLIVNFFLLIIHLYVSIKHILLDYIRNIDTLLMYIFSIIINYILYTVILIYFYQLNIYNISYIIENSKFVFSCLFFLYLNLFLINKSVAFMLTKKTNIVSNVRHKDIYYVLNIFLICTFVLYLITNFINLDFFFKNIILWDSNIFVWYITVYFWQIISQIIIDPISYWVSNPAFGGLLTTLYNSIIYNLETFVYFNYFEYFVNNFKIDLFIKYNQPFLIRLENIQNNYNS